MAQLKDYSIPELIHLLGSRYRDYRQRADMTQKEVAERIRHRQEKTSKPKIKEL